MNAGIEQNVHAHLFRHSLATHLLEDGRTIVDVMQKLGHSNIAVTSIYLHSNPETVKSKSLSLGEDLLSYSKYKVADENNLVPILHSLLLQFLCNTNNIEHHHKQT
jgi:Site-specific recombinase XerD